MKVTASAFEKFENPPQGPPKSRYQVWKFHVCPAKIQPAGGFHVEARKTIPGPIEPTPVGEVTYGGSR